MRSSARCGASPAPAVAGAEQHTRRLLPSMQSHARAAQTCANPNGYPYQIPLPDTPTYNAIPYPTVGRRACSTVMRLRGSNCSIASNRSIAGALASGKSAQNWHRCTHAAHAQRALPALRRPGHTVSAPSACLALTAGELGAGDTAHPRRKCTRARSVHCERTRKRDRLREVKAVCVRALERCRHAARPRGARLAGLQRADVGARARGADEGQVLLGRRAERADDELQLVDVVAALEQRLALQQLRQDAAHRPARAGAGAQYLSYCTLPNPTLPPPMRALCKRTAANGRPDKRCGAGQCGGGPDVDRRGVVLAGQEQLRRAVPPAEAARARSVGGQAARRAPEVRAAALCAGGRQLCKHDAGALRRKVKQTCDRCPPDVAGGHLCASTLHAGRQRKVSPAAGQPGRTSGHAYQL